MTSDGIRSQVLKFQSPMLHHHWPFILTFLPGVLTNEDVGSLVEVDRLGDDDSLENFANLGVPAMQGNDPGLKYNQDMTETNSVWSHKCRQVIKTTTK